MSDNKVTIARALDGPRHTHAGTPGPWTPERNASDWDVVQTANGCFLAIVVSPPDDAVHDARLIAAAPDLLHAASGALLLLRDGGPAEDTTRIMQELADAIRKATGARTS